MHCELMLCLPSVEEKWGVAPIAAERGRGPVVVLPQGVPLDLELVPELLLARGAVEGDLRDLVGVVVDVPDVLAVPHLAWRGPGASKWRSFDPATRPTYLSELASGNGKWQLI